MKAIGETLILSESPILEFYLEDVPAKYFVNWLKWRGFYTQIEKRNLLSAGIIPLAMSIDRPYPDKIVKLAAIEVYIEKLVDTPNMLRITTRCIHPEIHGDIFQELLWNIGRDYPKTNLCDLFRKEGNSETDS